MNYWLLPALPFVMAFLNRIRGSRTEEFLPENWKVQNLLPNGAPFAAVGFGLFIYLFCNVWWIGLLTAVVYFAFETFGWGKWVISVPHWGENWQEVYNTTVKDQWDSGQSNGIHWLSNSIVKETDNFALYSMVALFFRGILWFFPIYLLWAIADIVTPSNMIVAPMVLGFAFPLVYKLSSTGYNDASYSAKAETYYGLVQGLVFALTLFVGAH